MRGGMKREGRAKDEGEFITPDVIASVLHEEKRWLPPIGTRLLSLKCNHSYKQVPIPLISELINKLQGAQYFTKLDVHWGFNNV